MNKSKLDRYDRSAIGLVLAQREVRAMNHPTTSSNTCETCLNFSKCLIQNKSIDTDKIRAHKRIYDYKIDDILVNEGDKLPMIGFIIEGVLRTTVTRNDGRQQILGIHLPSSLFGYPFVTHACYGVEAATNVRVCTFDRPSFERMVLADPELGHAILLATLHDLGIAQELVAILGSLRAPERIARFLLHLSGRVDGKAQELHIPVCRRDLAALLGTTPETISRFVQEMVRNGVLRVQNARTLVVLDRPKLEELAGQVVREVSAVPRRAVHSQPAISNKPADLVARLRNRRYHSLAANQYPGQGISSLADQAAKSEGHNIFSRPADIDDHQ